MASLDHWHPLLLSSHLKDKPVSVRLDGQEIVVFRQGRDAEGNAVIGALNDHCPHRRMRLSCGSVVDGKLQCLYHGWTFSCDGAGESPGTPKLYARAEAYHVVERHGAIWIKSADSNPVFPRLEIEGYYNICNLQHHVRAPLELVVDNFCEIEHTPTTHEFFGYPLERMHEVEVEFLPTDTTVRVVNHGPRKNFNPIYRWLLGVGDNYRFHDDWTTHFSPIYSVYDHWWADPETGRESMVRWRLYIFFTPACHNETVLTTFAYTKSRYPGRYGAARLFGWLIRRNIDHEIKLDKRILENLADQNPNMEGMKLSRFDRVLGLNRERLERIYRGNDQGWLPLRKAS